MPRMSESTEFKQNTEELEHEIQRLWVEYKRASAEDKPCLRARYLDALRRFSDYVNPS